MKHTLVRRFVPQIAGVLVLMLAAQMSEAAVLQEQAAPPQVQQQQTPAPAEVDQQQTGKPGTDLSHADLPQAPAPASQQTEISFASSSQDAQPQDAQKPVGTAAGPYTKPTGVAGSRPSGAAIAPAKQKRKKALALRVGLIVGGAVAVGTVAGLSMASSSRP
jgi:hypothetical protein